LVAFKEYLIPIIIDLQFGSNDIFTTISAMSKTIAFLIYDRFQLLDAAGPITAFEISTHGVAPAPYSISVIAPERGLITSSALINMHAESMHSEQNIDTLVVIGGTGAPQAATCPMLLKFVREQAKRARRICSVCTGAYILAAAGLLDGRNATTHWDWTANFARTFPKVKLNPDQIYTQDGNIWTSAGITAGIDLALALIAEDLGEPVAKRVAQKLVVYYRRPGGQSQFSELLNMAQPESRFSPLCAWIRVHVGEPLPVERLAQHLHMSPRNFARLFLRETGLTPAKAVEKIRLEVARELIERGDESMEMIAEATGFGDTERMRRSFNRVFGQPPRSLRRIVRSRR
jgi:transcriptional regulator GlxA family with amidase domain